MAADELQVIQVTHACGCRVLYRHGLGPFIIGCWMRAQAEVPCRRCLAQANLGALMTRRHPAGAVQLALF